MSISTLTSRVCENLGVTLLTLALTFLCLCCSPVVGQACLQRAEEVAPSLTKETRREFETKLIDARKNFETEPSADNLLWLGRRTAYLGHYKDAIKIYTQGSKSFLMTRDSCGIVAIDSSRCAVSIWRLWI